MPLARCNECKEVFSSRKQCSKHAKEAGHAHNPAYFCAECPEVFTTTHTQEEHRMDTGHIVEVTLQAAAEMFDTCVICKPTRTFVGTAAYDLHYGEMHANSKPRSSTQQLPGDPSFQQESSSFPAPLSQSDLVSVSVDSYSLSEVASTTPSEAKTSAVAPQRGELHAPDVDGAVTVTTRRSVSNFSQAKSTCYEYSPLRSETVELGIARTPRIGHRVHRTGRSVSPGLSISRSGTVPNGTVVRSFHCRSCLRSDPVSPVSTMCGHLFCESCIVQEIASGMCCPVCQKTFMIKLHVEMA
ncbi:hypothetical protein C8Q80DRAFT_753634 [Daedaleopsis nitida]|nr:hypothetical protein C8Q80DRAFT_753634 [Daedaleopsis nitida]